MAVTRQPSCARSWAPMIAAAWPSGGRAITWTLGASGILADGNNGFYYQTFDSAITREGDLMKVIHALAQDVSVRGVFPTGPLR